MRSGVLDKHAAYRNKQRVDLPKLIKLVWASPCSAVGLIPAALILARGGKAIWNQGALEVTYRQSRSSCGKFSSEFPIRGIVFGHVILAVTCDELEIIGSHERVHVEQYERWGAFFFIAYGLSSLWQFLRGRNPYWYNHFEIQARERSARRSNWKNGAKERNAPFSNGSER